MEDRDYGYYESYLYSKLSMITNIEKFIRVEEDGYDDEEKDYYPKTKMEKYWDYLCDKRDLSFVKSCDDEYAIIYDSEIKKCNIMDKHGKILSKKWYKEIHYFDGKFIIRNKWSTIIDPSGELTIPWCSWLSEPVDGKAIINRDDKYNLIDKDGNILLKDWYDDIDEFYFKYTLVKKDDKYNLMDSSGNLVSEKWFDCFYRLTDKTYTFTLDGEAYVVSLETGKIRKFSGMKELPSNVYLFIDNGYHIFNSKINDFISVGPFDDVIYSKAETLFVVKKDNKYNIYDYKNNKLILDEWLDEEIKYISWRGLNRPYDKGSYQYEFKTNSNRQIIIDDDGEVILDKVQSADMLVTYQYDHVIKYTFYVPHRRNMDSLDDMVEYDIDLNGYECDRTIFGYKCYNDEEKFRIPNGLMPVKIYGFSYVICADTKKERYYLYDRTTKSITELGWYGQVNYNDHFIRIRNEKKLYFYYNNNLFDISRFVDNFDELKFTGNEDDPINLLTEEGFAYFDIDKQMELVEEAREEKNNKEKNSKKTDINKQIEQQRQEEESLALERTKVEKEALLKMKNAIEILSSLKSNNQTQRIEHTRYSVSNLLIDFGNHKEINPNFIDVLKYIDLSAISFKNVKVSGIDFRDCNADIIPKQVYNQDLSGCNFEGIFISEFMDFSGCDIRGARFSDDDDPMTPDGRNMSFGYAIYDETTTYNGIPFTQIYGPCNKTLQSENKLNKM